MAESLPRFFALGYGGKYLRYVLEEGETHSRMQAISDKVVSEQSFTKLEIVSSESSFDEDSPVHIRSSYNNKFLRLSAPDKNWVVAGADQPEEDQSKWSCTLFKVTVIKNSEKFLVGFTLLAAGGTHAVQVSKDDIKCLIVVRNSTAAYLLGIADLDLLAILPKHVVFKGSNGKYLESRDFRTKKRLQFRSSSITDRKVHHESYMLPKGDYRFRSIEFNEYWRKSGPNWIWCDSGPNNVNPETVFRAERVDTSENSITLRCRANNLLCRRRTKGGQPRLKDTLIADVLNVQSNAVLQVEEAVRDRQIYDVQYRMDDARIYDVGLVNSVEQVAKNTTNIKTTGKLVFTYTKLTRETYNTSHSWKVKATATIKAKVPVFAQGTIKLERSYDGSVNWSKIEEKSEELTSSMEVEVPPMTRVVVNMLVGRGSIDVPFSYTQRDVLYHGKVVTERLHDGIFSGLNTETIDYTISEEPISQDSAELAVSSKL